MLYYLSFVIILNGIGVWVRLTRFIALDDGAISKRLAFLYFAEVFAMSESFNRGGWGYRREAVTERPRTDSAALGT